MHCSSSIVSEAVSLGHPFVVRPFIRSAIVVVAGACISHYRACLAVLFGKKRRNVPDQLELQWFTTTGWSNDDTIDELSHKLDSFAGCVVAFGQRRVDVGNP